MKVSSGGHDNIMVLVATGLVFLIASGLAGGPHKLLRLIGHTAVDIFGSAWGWIRSATNDPPEGIGWPLPRSEAIFRKCAFARFQK